MLLYAQVLAAFLLLMATGHGPDLTPVFCHGQRENGAEPVFTPRAAVNQNGAFRVIDDATPKDLDRLRAFAAGRTGYVVWESRRPSGTPELKYRIWKRNLAGSGLAMISGAPLRAGYSHVGPRISPDGRFVVFAGRKWDLRDGRSRYEMLHGGAYAPPPYDAWVVEMDPVTLEPASPRELLCLRGQMGGAGQNRFFEWKDHRTIYVNIPSQQGVFEVDVIDDRIGPKCVAGVKGQRLLSAGGQHLFCSAPGGCAVWELDRTAPVATVGRRRRFAGCQAIPSPADDFVIWMRSSGRVGVLDLCGDRTPTEGNEPGGPLGVYQRIARDYPAYDHCYFPAIGRDRTVLACAASRYPPGLGPAAGRRRHLLHSHRGADYEIFLVGFDPEALRLVGPAVRYSYNDHTGYPEVASPHSPHTALVAGHTLDRFPDVWVRSEQSEDRRRAPRPADEVEGLLAEAGRLETVDPPAAIKLYERIASERAQHPVGHRAARRLADLERSPEFQNELAAWELLEALRRTTGGFRAESGGAAHGPQPNAASAIRSGYAALLKTYPNTRAMLEARCLVRRLNVQVPREVPASRREIARVEGVIQHVSTPVSYREIYPYTQAFLTARCRVRRVVSGSLREKTVVVVLMSINGRENLPPASYRPGDVCRMRLGLWSEQTHFESHPISDEIVDLDADYYYAFATERID